MTSKHTMSGVKVKELEWVGPDSDGEHYSKDGLFLYIVRPKYDSKGYWLTNVGKYFPTREAAKAAAQADYEARILSALVRSDAEPVAYTGEVPLAETLRKGPSWFRLISVVETDTCTIPLYAHPPCPDSSSEVMREALERLINNLNPEEALDDSLLRDIHQRLVIHGEKYPERMVSVLHRNVVLYTIAAAIQDAMSDIRALNTIKGGAGK